MSRKRRLISSAPLFALGAAILAGCTAQLRVAAPVVYTPPPPDVAVVASDPDTVIEADVAPPALPVYEQPPCPVDGWIWTPGYWSWGEAGYYWVPGTWVAPPRVGFLWTPGYWGFVRGVYVWHAGYWGPHVGFYGGVHYGFGYTGVGYVGGRWVGGVFAYNRAVTRVNVIAVHNTYNETVVNHVDVHITRISYNGGAGGIRAIPTAEERAAIREAHLRPTFEQRQHIQRAQRNPALQARANGGRPAIAATPRAGEFNAPGIARARGAAAGAVTEPRAGAFNSPGMARTRGDRSGSLATARRPESAQPDRRDAPRRAAHPNQQRKPARRGEKKHNG